MSDYVRDLLVRGIAAAKTNDPKDRDEARDYLNRVVRAADAAGDQKAKAWLWLSQLEDDPAKKRDCLENVLAIDPADPLARRGLAILDGRLNAHDVIDPSRLTPTPIEPAAKTRRYVCPQCGGKLAYAADKRALLCGYCGNTLTEYQALQQGALVQEQDFTATLPTARAHRWELATRRAVKCEGCGAAFTLPPAQLSGDCPFCGSAHIVITAAAHDLIRPDGVLPFQFDAEQARRHIHAWIDRQKFRPGDLDERAAVPAPRGVYLPCWTFDLGGQMTWHAQVYEERFGRKGYYPRSDLYLIYHNDLIVPATHSIPKARLDNILDYDTRALVPYSIELLADRAAEIYQVPLADASLVARQRALEAGRRDVQLKTLAGEQIKDFQMNSLGLIVESYKLALLPVWIGAYRYRGVSYEVIVNGQTGTTAGDVPRKGWQKALAGLLD